MMFAADARRERLPFDNRSIVLATMKSGRAVGQMLHTVTGVVARYSGLMKTLSQLVDVRHAFFLKATA